MEYVQQKYQLVQKFVKANQSTAYNKALLQVLLNIETSAIYCYKLLFQGDEQIQAKVFIFGSIIN